MKTYAVHDDQPQSIEYTSQFFVHAKNRRSDDHEASDKYHIVVDVMYAVAFFPLILLLMFTVLNYYFIYPKLYSFLEQTGNATSNNNTIQQPRIAANSNNTIQQPCTTATAQHNSLTYNITAK